MNKIIYTVNPVILAINFISQCVPTIILTPVGQLDSQEIIKLQKK